MPFSSPTSMPTLTSFCDIRVVSVDEVWKWQYIQGCANLLLAKYSATIGRCHNISDGQQATIHNFGWTGCFRKILDPAPNLGSGLIQPSLVHWDTVTVSASTLTH